MRHTAIIVGGGIGGLAAATALRRTGWTVDVYEQAPAIGPVGAGIGIAPNAVKALDHLGLGEALRKRSLRQRGMAIRLKSGRHVVEVDGDDIEARYGAPFVTLHRAELHGLLLDALGDVGFHTGRRAAGVTTTRDGAEVAFDDGSSARADLVVAADGVHSALRSALFPAYPGPAYAGYTVWRGIVPAADAERIGVPPVLSETWARAARFGIAPINDGQVYWFAAENLREGERPPHDLGRVAARFGDWHRPVPELLAATPPDSLLRHDVYYLDTSLPSFVSGRAVLLGDAAHAVTPDIGQGACLSIEDGVVLAAAVEAHGIDEGLRVYDAERRPRTEKLAQLSGRLGRMLQTGHPLAARLRDTVAGMLPGRVFLRFAGGAFAWEPPGHGVGRVR